MADDPISQGIAGASLKRWYFAEFGEQKGPVDDVEFAQMMASQRIGPLTLVWRDGMPAWMSLAQARSAGRYGLPNPYTLGGSGLMGPGTSPYAMPSLIFGLLTLPLCCLPAVPAVILGHLALSQYRRSPLPMVGRGMAVAGLILGYIGVAIILYMILRMSRVF